MADLAAPVPQDAEALLESSWGRRGAPVPRRERLMEVVVTAGLLAACLALLNATSLTSGIDLAVIPVLAAYAASIRVVFPVGAGFTTPSQLFLFPLFALAPAPVVPLLVVAALVVARLVDVALGRARMDRLVVCGGNAIYTLGPALVLTAAGRHDSLSAPVPLLLAAFAAQLLFDLLSGVIREWLCSGVRPDLQLRVQAQVWAVDAALTPLGLLAAYAGARVSGAFIALWPLVMLLGHMARDRERRIARAHERLQALERERARLRVAVHRIGDAFASNLDLDALLQIVTRACVDALDADAGRASVDGGGRRVARVQVGEDAGMGRAMETAERAAVDRGELVNIGEEGDWVLSAPLGARLASGATGHGARRAGRASRGRGGCRRRAGASRSPSRSASCSPTCAPRPPCPRPTWTAITRCTGTRSPTSAPALPITAGCKRSCRTRSRPTSEPAPPRRWSCSTSTLSSASTTHM